MTTNAHNSMLCSANGLTGTITAWAGKSYFWECIRMLLSRGAAKGQSRDPRQFSPARGQKSPEPSWVWDGAEERGDTPRPAPKAGLAVHIPEMRSLIRHWLQKQRL